MKAIRLGTTEHGVFLSQTKRQREKNLFRIQVTEAGTERIRAVWPVEMLVSVLVLISRQPGSLKETMREMLEVTTEVGCWGRIAAILQDPEIRRLNWDE